MLFVGVPGEGVVKKGEVEGFVSSSAKRAGHHPDLVQLDGTFPASCT